MEILEGQGVSMKDKIIHNLGTKVLSVILAIIIWLLVTNIDNPYTTKTFTDIPVNVINEDVLLKKNKTWDIIEGNKVSVTIKAKRNIIDKIGRSDIRASADLSKLSITNAVPINVTVDNYDEVIKEKSLGNIDTLKVKLENIEQQQFPVTIETTGEVRNGYAVGSKIPTPNIVEVTGPESLVRRIHEVRVSVNVEGLTESQSFSIEPFYYTDDGEKMDSSRLSCNVKRVDVAISLLQTKKVDLKVETTGEVAKGYELESILLEPKSILIAGTKKQLKNVSEILIEGLSIEGLKEDTEENIDINDYLPEGIKLAQDSPDVRVKIQVTPLDVRNITIPVEKLTIRNQDQSYRLEYLEDTITVSIRGEKQYIENVVIEDMKPVIDLSEAKEGEQTVKVYLQDLQNVYYESNPEIRIRLTDRNIEGVPQE